MKNYELTYIISPEVSEGGIKNIVEKINGFILEENGKIEKMSTPLRKNLGYPINKKESGFLTVVNFSLEPEKLGDLEKKLKAKTEILRYLVLRKKIKERVSKKRILPEVKTTTLEFGKRAKPKKVELKDIDKKIEEILKNTD